MRVVSDEHVATNQDVVSDPECRDRANMHVIVHDHIVADYHFRIVALVSIGIPRFNSQSWLRSKPRPMWMRCGLRK